MSRRILLSGLAALLLLPACVTSNRNGDSGRNYIEAGDLTEIELRGVLRILVPAQDPTRKPSPIGVPLDYERELLRAYADQNGLVPRWIEVTSRDELIPFLIEGRGDVVAANLTATDERRKHVDFTVPLRFVREQIVTRAGDATIELPMDLDGRRVAVRRSSSFWSTLESLRRDHPEILIEPVPEGLETEELIRRVAQRQLDLTIADSDLVESVLSYRTDIRSALDLTDQRPIAWAIRSDSLELQRSLNLFLTETAIAERRKERRVGDLDEIRKRKVLRVLTRNSASTYFLWRGELLGFEYELSREFARSQGLRVEVVVPPRAGDLLSWLVEGRGDVVAAALTPSETHRGQGVSFSRPYNHAARMIVTRASEPELLQASDLAERRVFVRPSSSHWGAVNQLRREGVELSLEPAAEELESEEIIALVADGTYDLAISYSHILDIELTWRDDVRGALAVGEQVPLAWAVREANPELKAAIDAFLDREYRGLFYNVTYDRYFRDPKHIQRHVEQRISPSGALSPYDEIVKRYAGKYDFDWRMIVAQMYQESRFDPTARSFAGAVGLLQVLPRTGRQMGFNEVGDPESNIAAGVKYMDWLWDRFPDEDLPVADRMWFTLASYNAGHEHVRDARRLAEEMGWDPNSWFENVERAMLLLSKRQYASQARHGYCRGREPVNYVREIIARYGAYREALDPETGPVVQTASGP